MFCHFLICEGIRVQHLAAVHPQTHTERVDLSCCMCWRMAAACCFIRTDALAVYILFVPLSLKPQRAAITLDLEQKCNVHLAFDSLYISVSHFFGIIILTQFYRANKWLI